MIKQTGMFLMCLTVILAFSQISYAKNFIGEIFSRQFTHDGTLLELKGTGLKRVFFLKAFYAGFYLEKDIEIKDVRDDVAKRIEVVYFVKIQSDKLSDYTEELMERNVSSEEFSLLQDKIKTMRTYFVDLKPSDRYALTYIPGMGTQFEYNGDLIGTIQGETFAKALFSTWIGDNPMDEKIKDKILGLASDIDKEEKVVLAEIKKVQEDL